MNREQYKQLGIYLDDDISAYELFSEKYNPGNLEQSTKNRIVIVRDLIQEYNTDTPLIQEQITDSDKAYQMLAPIYKGLNHEEIWILLLDGGNRPIKRMKISEGDLKSSIIDHRRIIREMILCGSSSLIISHNHPSANVNPSVHDIESTKELKEKLNVFNMALLDHLIIGDGKYYSFANENETIFSNTKKS